MTQIHRQIILNIIKKMCYRIIKHIIAIVSALFLFSCTKDAKEFSLRLINDINIRARDSTDWVQFYCNIYYDNKTNKEYFVWNNDLLKTLDFYSLDDGMFAFSYRINIFQRIDGFFINNFDSIFILNKKNNEIGLFNRMGKLTRMFNFNSFMSNKVAYSCWSTIEAPFIFRLNKFYINIGANLEVEKFLKHPKLLIINIENNEIKSCNKSVFFPINYLQNIDYGFYSPSYALSPNGLIICSFEVCHFICIYKNDKLIKTLAVKSKYLNKFEESDKSQSSNLNYNIQFQIKNPRYGGIYYDRYNNLYYRIANHKQNLKDENNLPNDVGDNPWSIIIMNDNFKLLNELFIPKQKYYSYIFITKKGILLLKNRKTHQGNRYYFCFSLFKLKHEI